MRKNHDNPNEYSDSRYSVSHDPYSGDLRGEPSVDFPGFPQPVPVRRSNRTIPRLIAFLLSICILLVLLQSLLFRVQTIYVVGADSQAAEHIVALSGLVKGESIVNISESKVRRNLASNQWITLLHLFKRYPSEVFLVVSERKVAASMQWLGIEYTLDIDGMVLEEYTDMDYSGDLPIVYGFKVGNAAVGDTLSVRDEKQLIAYSSIVSELTIQKYIKNIKSINVSDIETLTLVTHSGITVQLGDGNYMRAKIGAMRTDIAYLQQVGETSGVLDVSIPEDGKFKRE